MRLVLLCGPDGTVVDFVLVPADSPEREAGLALLRRQSLHGQLILRPSRADEPDRITVT